MPPYSAGIVILLLAAGVLIALDRIEVNEFQAREESALSLASAECAAHLNHFFHDRINAVRAFRLVLQANRSSPQGTRLSAAGDTLLARFRGDAAIALLDAEPRPLSVWPASAADGSPLGACLGNADLLRTLSARARALGHAAVSDAMELPDGEFAFLVVEHLDSPAHGSARLVAGAFRLWPLARRFLHTGSHDDLAVFVEDPSGNVLAPHESFSHTRTERRKSLPVGDRVWTLHVRPKPEAAHALIQKRVATWSLGLVLMLTALLLYLVLADRNAQLAKDKRHIEAQARATRELNRKLVRANRELHDFAHTVSHDLKEPLRGIEGLTRCLVDECRRLDPLGHQYIKSIRDSGRRMQRLVDDLLRLSRSGRRTYPYQVVDFNELLHEVLDALGPAIAGEGAAVTIAPNLPRISCDRVRMAELFRNLISNGIKFRDGTQPAIHIGYEERPDTHLFWVQDNGIGLRPEDRERIFCVCQRVETHTDATGTGVGLTICAHTVEHHGGRIWVESALGSGSRFCFILPKRPPDQAPAPDAHT